MEQVLFLTTILLHRFIVETISSTNLEECINEGIKSFSTRMLKKQVLSEKHCLGKTDVVFTRDPLVADYVFIGPRNKNYVERWGNEDGLRTLGMYDAGIIWNNTNLWESQRQLFQKAINGKAIDQAVAIASDQAMQIFESASMKPQDVDVLNLMRKVTFRTTLHVFFGIRDVLSYEDDVIASIVSYFKAWEFFLIRPAKKYTSREENMHKESILCLSAYVADILSLVVPEDDNFASTLLRRQTSGDLSEQMASQCALEMLLAGTDTSSVTLFYAILALAEYPELEEELFNDLIMQSCKTHNSLWKDREYDEETFQKENEVMLVNMFKSSTKSKKLDCFVKEVLRFKPVGPIVIRRACHADVLPGNIQVRKGDAVVINLEMMHHLESLFPVPNAFSPTRFDDGQKHPNFYPFGAGPKGCVGQFFGEAEVKAVLVALVRRYRFKSQTPLKDLETHWDIANQPSAYVSVELVRRSTSVILTGAHSTGKTHLCDSFIATKPDFEIVHEIARSIMRTNGKSINFYMENPSAYIEFQYEILQEQARSEQRLRCGPRYISDRGLDPLAYLSISLNSNYASLTELDVFPLKEVELLTEYYRQSVNILIEPHEGCIKDDGVRMKVGSILELGQFNTKLVSILCHLKIPYYNLPRQIPLSKRLEYLVWLYAIYDV